MSNIKNISKNRRAFHNYHISERFEAGISLLGTEVKAIRDGRINLTDGWVDISSDNQAVLRDVHIGHYRFGNQFNHDELRMRKLLLHKKEIQNLKNKSEGQGVTIIPISFYFKDSLIKVEIAVAKGKKLYDKRQASKAKEDQKDIERAFKRRNLS